MVEQGVLSWLLAPENPSARYLTLRFLLGRPESDREVQSAREAIAGMEPVRAVLDAQYPAGYWVRPGRGYSPRHRATVWQVILFADLGMPSVEGVARACEHVLSNALHPLGLFSAHVHSTGVFPCLNGDLLRAFWSLGYGEHHVVVAVAEKLALRVLGEGFVCPRNGSHPRDRASWRPCVWGGVKVLRGLAAVPPGRRSPAVRRAIEEGVSFLLAHELTRPQLPELAPLVTDERDAWLRFGFPTSYAADLLEAALSLVEAGERPPADVLSAIAQKRGPAGRWVLERTPPGMWSALGVVGQDDRWITLRALRVTGRGQPVPDHADF